MDLTQFPKAIIDAGGWAFAAVTLGGIIAAIVRGDLVPGALYRREVTRADGATKLLEEANSLGRTLTAQVDTLVAQVDTLVKIVGDVFRPRL